MARRARKNERGLTLIETLVALAIVFIVFMGLMEAGLLMLEYNINNTVRDEGVSVAEMRMEELRTTPYATLYAVRGAGPIGLATETRAIRGLSVDYNGTYEVTELNAASLQVAVNVTWARNAWGPSGRTPRNYNHQLVTLVRNR